MSKICELTNIEAQTGNKVSNSNIKTKRRFLPNLKYTSLKSDALNINLNLRLATKTIRTINKYGNLDSFLINFGYNKLSTKGRQLRKKVKGKLVDNDQLSNIKIVKNNKKGA